MGDGNPIERLNGPMTELSLLQSALRRAAELGLSADQLDRLRNLYAEARRDLNRANADLASAELDFELAQSHAGGLAAGGDWGAIETVLHRISDIRNRTTAVALAILTQGQRHALSSVIAPDEHPRNLRAALPSPGKDSKVVEIEIATAVLERMIGWSKIFGWSIAIPAAVLVAILSIMGIGKCCRLRFESERIRKTSHRVRCHVRKADF
jgi:hypothetical protein